MQIHVTDDDCSIYVRGIVIAESSANVAMLLLGFSKGIIGCVHPVDQGMANKFTIILNKLYFPTLNLANHINFVFVV